MADELMHISGADALTEVSKEQGGWNWCLVGADPEALPLAGGGSGFVGEMHDCIASCGDEVLCGLLRLEFRKIQGDSLKAKWIIVFCTLDEGNLSAVQRGKLVGKRPTIQKKLAEFCKVVTHTWEVTELADLTVDKMVDFCKKNAIIDGELVIPEYKSHVWHQPALPDEAAAPPPEAHAEEYDPEGDKKAAEEAAAASESTSSAAPPPKDEGYKAEPAPAAIVGSLDDFLNSNSVPCPYKKGDKVDIFSQSEKKWYVDGVVEEVRTEASTTADGTPLPAGCAKIVYGNGQRGKWLQAEVLADRSILKPSIRPPPFTGNMMKETHNMFTEWHPRYFELRDGFISWWCHAEDQLARIQPQQCFDLGGLQMKSSDQSTKICIRTTGSRGKIYNFDTAAASDAKPTAKWVDALKQHAAFANRLHKFREAKK